MIFDLNEGRKFEREKCVDKLEEKKEKKRKETRLDLPMVLVFFFVEIVSFSFSLVNNKTNKQTNKKNLFIIKEKNCSCSMPHCFEKSR